MRPRARWDPPDPQEKTSVLARAWILKAPLPLPEEVQASPAPRLDVGPVAEPRSQAWTQVSLARALSPCLCPQMPIQGWLDVTRV